jgi:hypothetical protein
MKQVVQTRFKLVIGLIGLGLIEGLLKTWLIGFPLTEVFAFQGMVAGGYLTVRTINNMKNNGVAE